MRACACLIAAAFLASVLPAQTADLILTNAVIFTGRSHYRFVSAIAVANGKILATGSDAAILQFAGPHTQVHNINTVLTHVYVLPGLINTHSNLAQTGASLMRLSIHQLSSEQRRRAIELAIADSLSRGVTTVHDFGSIQDFHIDQQLEQEGRLNIRIIAHISPKQALEESPITSISDNHLLQVDPAKKPPSRDQQTLLAPGNDADFILVDRDPFSTPTEPPADLRALETYVEGKQVFLAGVRVQ